MNIFYLHEDPEICAQMHNDKHVVKMILEYAQLLSTAHRVIDGVEQQALSKSGRKQKVWQLDDERETNIYKASHINHPSAKWVRHSEQNYLWLFEMWVELLREYAHRYDKVHSSDRLVDYLANAPKNIPKDVEWSPPWRAMPDEYKVDRSIEDYTVKSYRAYYLGAKVKMCRWTNREMPQWFADGINTLYEDACYIEHKPKLNRIISMPLQYANV
jgi:hypothetical protein